MTGKSKSRGTVAKRREGIGNDEIEAFSEVLHSNRDINDEIEVDLLTTISTDVTTSKIDGVANVWVRGLEDEVRVEITNEKSGINTPSTQTFLSGSPDDLEIFGRQLILTARHVRNLSDSGDVNE